MKSSFQCNEYRKYPLCSYEIQIIVLYYNPNSVTIISRNIHEHHQKERYDYLHPYDKQYRNTFIVFYLNLKLNYLLSTRLSKLANTLIHLINYERRKNRSEIFFAYDLKSWCDQHKDDTQLNSTYVPFYTIDNIFSLFTTKKVFQQLIYK